MSYSDIYHVCHVVFAGPPNSAWQSMHHLRSLSLAGNPITAVMNDSFVGLERLEELDISDIRADGFSVSDGYIQGDEALLISKQ